MPQYTRDQIQRARSRALEAGNQAAVQQADMLLAKMPAGQPPVANNGTPAQGDPRQAEIQRLSDPNNWTEQDIDRGIANAQAAGNWEAMLKFNEIRSSRFNTQPAREEISAMDRFKQMFTPGESGEQRMNEDGVLEIDRNILSGKDLVDQSIEGAARTFAGKFTQRAGGAAQVVADVARFGADDLASDERTMKYLRRRSPEMAERIEDFARRRESGELTEDEAQRVQGSEDLANQFENVSKLLYKKGQDQLEKVEELRPEGFMAGLTFDAANVLAYMGEGVLASVITRNPNAGLASMYSLVAGSEYNALRNEGYEPNDAMVRANLQALYETVPEKLFGVFDRIAGKGTAGRLIQSAAEGASEAVTEMATIIDEYARKEYDGDLMDALERVGYAALVGSFAGLFLPGGRREEIDLTTADRDRGDDDRKPNRGLDDLNEAEGRQADDVDGDAAQKEQEAQGPGPTITILDEAEQAAPQPDAIDRARQQEPMESGEATDRTARPEVKRSVDPNVDGVFAETGRHNVSGRPVSYGLVFPGNLGVDSDTYQYKATDDAEGRTDRFSGEEEWSSTAAGEVIVHRRADGDFIADGHQRRGLARAARERGQDPGDLQSRAIILNEADGWGAEEVRLFAAMQNIKQETGTAVDAAKVMREGGPELREEMGRHMNPRRAAWRDAEGLSRLSQDVFDNVVAERLKPEHGAAIGEHIENEAKQLAANRYFMENPPSTREEAESIARDINRMEAQQGGGQGDMFGEMLAELPLAERAAILKEAKKKARTLRRTFNALVRNQTLIEGGDASNVLDKDGNARVANDATVVTDLLNRLVDTSPAMNEVLNDEANKLAAGETTRSEAADRIFAEAERLSASLPGRGADQAGDEGPADGGEPGGGQGEEVQGEIRTETGQQPAQPEREQDDGAADQRDEVEATEEIDAGPDQAPEAPAAEEAEKPATKPGKRVGKTFTLKSLLQRKDQETLAELRADTMGSRMGAVLAETDSAMRAVEKQLRDKGQQFTPGDSQDTQEGTWLQTALVHVQDLLELHRDHGAEVVWPERDENGDGWEWPEGFDPEMADPIFYAPLDVLEHLDVAMAMGFPVDAATMEGMGDPLPGDGRPVRMDPTDVFPDAETTKSIDTELKNANQLPLDEAQARVQSWKDRAAQIGEEQDNSNKVVISLFDFEGSWSQPWEDAGYTVLRYDIKTGSDILLDDFFWNRLEELREGGMEIYGVLSACPCTTFASGSGAQWWKKRHDVKSQKYLAQTFGSSALASGAESAGEYNLMLVQATRDAIEAANPTGFHVLENPIGRINTSLSEKTGLKAPILRFHPHNFGDPYTKRTQIWGSANVDLPTANVNPSLGSKMQNTLRGDKALDKEARSITPEGFAYAFFMANHPGAMEGVNQENSDASKNRKEEDQEGRNERQEDLPERPKQQEGEQEAKPVPDAQPEVTGWEEKAEARYRRQRQQFEKSLAEDEALGYADRAERVRERIERLETDQGWQPPPDGMTSEQIRQRVRTRDYSSGINVREGMYMASQDPVAYAQGEFLLFLEPSFYGPTVSKKRLFDNGGLPTMEGQYSSSEQEQVAEEAIQGLIDLNLVEMASSRAYRLTESTEQEQTDEARAERIAQEKADEGRKVLLGLEEKAETVLDDGSHVYRDIESVETKQAVDALRAYAESVNAAPQNSGSLNSSGYVWQDAESGTTYVLTIPDRTGGKVSLATQEAFRDEQAEAEAEPEATEPGPARQGAGPGPDRPGPADAGADGAVGSGGSDGRGVRPPLRVASPELLPEPTAHVGDDTYDGRIDEGQRLAVNLAIDRFEAGGRGFMLADGTGTGKTRQMLAIADQHRRRTGKPVLIVTENASIIADAFERDAREMGIDLRDFELTTYPQVRAEKAGQGAYGLVIFDEAHNLKNQEAAKTVAANAISADHRLFATATPLDKLTGAVYFLSEITGIEPKQIYDRIGLEVRVDTDGPRAKQYVVPKEGVEWGKVASSLIDLRNKAVEDGAFIRREYPFFGSIEDDGQFQLTKEQREEQERIWDHWQGRIDEARSPKVKGNLSGQRLGELSRWAEAQKKEAVFRNILSELNEGRSVVVVAEGVNDTEIKGLGGKKEAGLIGWLADQLTDQGIDFGQIYGAGKSKKIKAASDFQSGKVRVVLATPKSGGTGINLDDVSGDAPRTMIVATANYSGDVFDQIIGRISRRNTASPSKIINVSSADSISDQRRGVILKKKLAALRAIQSGSDVDGAYLEDSQVEDGEIRFMFAGPRAKDADRGRLASAYKMLAQGQDPEQVRKSTGWFKGADGNWRFEIDDSEGTVPTRDEIVAEKMTDSQGFRLGLVITALDSILDHPALFRAYPELRRLEVMLEGNGGDRASYSVAHSGPYIKIGVNDDGINRSTLLHEIQHAIQHVEGFARGGNFDEFMPALQQEEARRRDAVQKLRGLESEVLDGKTLVEVIEERNEQVAMGLIEESEARQAIDEASRKLDEIFDGNEEAERLISIANRQVLTTRQRYARLAGEIEARNTQARSEMTAEERAETSPESTQDISSDKAIIRYHKEAIKAQSAPIPIDGAAEIADHLNRKLADWGDARKRVAVVQREDQLPVEIQREIINQGAEGEIAGVYFAGQVYLVADNISTVERAEQVLLHELKGHFALRDMVGQELKTILERIYNSYGRRGLADVIEQRFPESGPRKFDPQNQRHRLEVAEEKLAGLAETDPKGRWVRRAMAALRDWVRRMGFRFGLNDTDLIGLMARASEYIESPPSVRDATGLPTWARADHLPPMRPTLRQLSDTIDAYTVEQMRRLGQAMRPGAGWSRMNRAELTAEIRAALDASGAEMDSILPIESWEALQGNAIRFSELDQQGLFGEEPSRTQQDLERKRREIEERLKGGAVPVEDGDGDLFNPNPNDQRPLFARNQPGPTKRAMSGLGSAVWWVLNQPAKLVSGANWTMDQLLLSPLRVIGGVDDVRRSKLGIAIHSRIEDAVTEGTLPGDNTLSNAVNNSIKVMRHGFIDRYGQPAEYVERDRERTREQARIMTVLQTILKRLKMEGIDAKEARVLQDILEGKPTTDERLKRVSEPIRRTIDDLGYELVQLGYLDAETWQKNLGSYLHRSYAKHEGDLSDLPGLSRKILGRNSRSLVGDQLKARGILHDVTMDKLERVTPPEWWGSKKRAGRADKSLKGTMWIVLEKTKGPDPDQAGTQTDEELQMERKTRVVDRVWVPAENGIPRGYEGWDNRGTFEVLNVDGDTITMRRDYTEAEQEAMGKVMDARYNLIRTFQLFAHDISSGRFFEDIAKNDQWAVKKPPAGAQVTQGKRPSGKSRGLSVALGYDWVEVPEDFVTGTRTKRWGALAGMYVRPEIWIDMNELDKAGKKGLWDSVLTHWKLNKTARNPVVHLNNVMSNLVLMDLIDVSVVDLMDAIESYVSQDIDHIEAQKAGAYGQMFVDEELNRNALDPIIREMRSEARKADNSVQGRAKFLWTALDKLYRGVRSADDSFIQMYQAEDAVFRLATFKKYRRHGYSSEESATIAVEQFLNYDIRAPWVNVMRRSFWPFISYTYRAVPAVAKAIAHRPHKFAKMVIIGQILNMLAYELSGDDEDEERETMPGRLKGMTWAQIPGTDIGLHRLLKLPVKDEYDQSLFLDITRWMPAGDVFDLNGALPAWLSIGGPAVIAGELLANRSLFTFDEIYNRDLASVDARLDFWNMPQVQDAAGHAWRSYAPGALFIPGTWHYEKISAAIDGGSDIMDRQYSVPAAVSSGLGVKIRPHDPETAMFFRATEIQRQLRAAQQEMSSARRRYSRNLITKEEMDEQIELLERRARALREDADEDLRRD